MEFYNSGFGGDFGGSYGGYDLEEEQRRRERERQEAAQQQSPYQTPAQADEKRQPQYQNQSPAQQQEPERDQRREQDTRTFAQRQAAGEARPAPPPPVPPAVAPYEQAVAVAPPMPVLQNAPAGLTQYTPAQQPVIQYAPEDQQSGNALQRLQQMQQQAGQPKQAGNYSRQEQMLASPEMLALFQQAGPSGPDGPMSGTAPGMGGDAGNVPGVSAQGVNPITTIGANRPDWMTETGGITKEAMPQQNPDGSTTWTNVEMSSGPAPVFKNGERPANAPNGSVSIDANGVSWTKRLGNWVAEGSQNQQKAAQAERDAAAPKQYGANNPPPATAPEGSTYADENGTKYTKRGGVWTTGGGKSGYDAFTPTVLQEQNAAAGQGGKLATEGIMQYLEQYGAPPDANALARMAASAGMSPDQLQQFIADSAPELERRAKQKEQGAYNKAYDEFARTNGHLNFDEKLVPDGNGGWMAVTRSFDEAAKALGGEQYVYGGRNLYERERAGRIGQRITRFDKAAPATAGGSNTGMGNAGPDTAAAPAERWTGTMPVSYAEPSPGTRMGREVTFPSQNTGVSSQGLDPIAAMAAPSAPAPAAPAGSTFARSRLEQALDNPSAFDNEQVMALYNRLGQGIDDQFSQQQTALREEMARRGLADSSIQGGRLSDLNIGQRQARTELADRLATARAQDFANARNTLLGLGLQQQGQDNSFALGQRGLDLQQTGQNNSYDLGLRGLDMQGRNLDAQIGQNAFANDLATAQFNRLLQTDQDALMLKLLGLGV